MNNILNIVLAIFIVLELSNIIILYFKPDFKHGNSMNIFKVWNKEDKEDEKLFKKYMANWVAGTKLIFIMLLIVILVLGTNEIKLWSLIVVIPSIATYYFKLYPLMKKMDDKDYLTQKGYSKTLTAMITSFIVMFIIAIIIYII